MNKTVDLVNLWAEYESSHPNAEIEDFCRYYLIRQREARENKELFGGLIPPDIHSRLSKLLGRVSRLHQLYCMVALQGSGIKTFEEFIYINMIGQAPHPRKTDVIYSNFNELSTGLLILDRLEKRGLIAVTDDPNDKRSRLLELTEEGKRLLYDCYARLTAMNAYFFQDLPDEDLNLCFQLMRPLDIRFSAMWQVQKGMTAEEIFASDGAREE